MSYIDPTVTDFKTYFNRDFPYNADINLGVTDGDISKAMSQCVLVIPQELFPSQEFYTTGFLYLSAHYLVENMSSATQGMSGRYEWAVASKSVGSVSVSFSIPENLVKNPLYSMYSKTNYGTKYLELIFPFLTGPMFSVQGRTHA